MSTLNQYKILEEVVFKLRNADIFTTTQRNVTTATATDTIAGTTILIAVNNVKNVRSVKIGSTTMRYGYDYSVDVNNAGGCLITFTASQNDTYEVVYDYGSDKIFTGYPRQDLTISAFPQIAVEFINITSDNGGFGNVNQNQYDISIVAYTTRKEDLRNYIGAIRQTIINNMNGFYYLKVVKPSLIGPIGLGEFEKFKDRIFQQNIDIRSILNLEIQ